MTFDLIKIYQHMGLFSLGIAWTLILFALGSLTVVVERLFVFARSRHTSRRFAAEAAPLIERADYSRLADLGAKFPASHLARDSTRDSLRAFCPLSAWPPRAPGPSTSDRCAA